ncbi:glutathione S-transferase T2-like [Panicum virgatum]|nr:glutathione S-transferase T2-like [Panicum virgatum]
MTDAPPPYPYPPYPYPPYPYPPPPTFTTSAPHGHAGGAASAGSENEGGGTTAPCRPAIPKKRNEWTPADEEKLVNAWLMHSVDCVDGNSKSGPTFWGQISDTYNATTDPLRHPTAKQLKDHWSMYNARVSLFNAIYNQEVSKRQSGADDDMVMDEAKARYARRAGHEFKLFHWWEAVRHQPKWSVKYGGGPNIDVSKRSRLGASGEYSSGSRETDEEVNRPPGRDRSKAAARKGKGKVGSSSHTSTDSADMGEKLEDLCKITHEYAQAKLWKQWNILSSRSTDGMTDAQKKVHDRALKRLQQQLHLDDDDE